MKNHLYLTFLILSSNCNRLKCESVDILGNSERLRKNIDLSKITKNGQDIPTNIFDAEKNFKDGNIFEYDKINTNNDNYNREKELLGRNSHAFPIDAGNPDIHGEILRPCQAYDTFCIRNFFAEHSKCRISGRSVPDPLFRAQGSVNFGSANTTESQANAVFGGLNNARISEFYINKVTDNVVIAVTFDSATKYSNNTYFKYHLRGREPIVTRDFGGIRYGVLTITVIIPQLKSLRLDRSEIYTYGDTNIYPFLLGPEIGTSTDPEVLAMYASFYTNIPTEYQEEMAHTGDFIVGNYIQYNICDFGLKIL